MSNFFAALDDSGDEAEIPKKTTKVTKKKETPKAPVVEPSKPERRRQKHDDRNTKSGRGRPPARDGKRSYDRRSGTGRGREIKKGGGGGRNWGSDKNDARRNQGAVDEKALEKKEADGVETPVEGEEPKVEEEKVEVKEEEPEDNTMSYEEYLKSKQSTASTILAPVEKKEFVNEFEGKNTHSVKKDEAFLVMGGGKQPRKKGAKKEEKKTLTPAFRVADPNKRERGGRDERGGRGDRRGGGRDRRGGRGGRGKGKPAAAINTADTDAFPTL